ncbi:MAG: YeeE/YedE family protein [Rhizobiales bacterium]|nr:YeeE/YedE family protein [Hyphomicrobiales bacterium]
MTATIFTPWASLLGGGLIGLSAAVLIVFNGRIAGISDIVGRLLPPWSRDGGLAGRALFVAGLIAAPLLFEAGGYAMEQTVSPKLGLLALAGVLVGFGTIIGNGCTSGHGVCGLARLSPRSLVATLVFMATAVVTVFVTRHLA